MAQEKATMTAEPQVEQQWLRKMVGEWTYEGEAVEPGKPPQRFRGTESVRMLGDQWLLGEGRGETPGGDTDMTLVTLGYDRKKRRIVGTWIGSMMPHLWVYDGTLAGNVLTLETEGPDMAVEGKTAKYKDVVELKSDDHRVLTSYVLGDDGEWHQMMTARYRRTR